MKFHALLVIALLPVVSACSEYSEPSRPAGVHESAVWQGAEDGGNWVRCEIKESYVQCQTYFNGPEAYSIQDFEVCAVPNASNWMSVPDGEGLRSVPVLGGSVFLKPIRAATYFRSGAIDRGPTEKHGREFIESETIDCEIRLVIVK